MVEMAIITPLILTLAAGVFEFSNIIHTKLLLEAGVRDAARYVARCNRGANAAACEAAAEAIAVDAGSGTARVTGWTVDDVEVAYDSVAVTIDEDGLANYRSSTSTVETVRVTSDYAYSGTGLWSYLGFGALTLSVSHEQRLLGN
jgi:Flp pilus assembly protein TadG